MSDDKPAGDIPEVLPASEPRRRRDRCGHCGSDDVLVGLKLGLNAEIGNVGPKYQSTGKLLGMALLAVEPLLIDLCNSCGSVVRLYVENPDRRWA